MSPRPLLRRRHAGGGAEESPASLVDVLELEHAHLCGTATGEAPGGGAAPASATPAAADLRGDEPTRLRANSAARLQHGYAALCLSGGGIRSASFALGVIQGLAYHNLLRGFDYLSTVSGGGYIGGWLLGWLRHAGTGSGAAAVFDELGGRRATGHEVEPEPVANVRANSRFMSPATGFFSADVWTLIATVARNLFLNWLVLLPLLAAALLLPVVYLGLL
ncbi:MAG TPA: patatin-like phospholipase family protein, partial [Vicinamibacterales bacterium]|nr:patatin-like phospholipase family protein [Vicinamibacterales bacterium]